MTQKPDSTEQRTSGFIVVTVLWMVAGLSALISIYAAYVIQTATGLAVHDDQLKARAMVTAAIEMAAYRQLSSPAQSRPTSGRLSLRLGAGNAIVVYQPETARIDLNAAPKVLLAGLFRQLGASPDAAENYAERVVAWRTPISPGTQGEWESYKGLGYGPRGAKFPHVNELALVRELPAQLIERAAPFVTVYSARPEVNIFEAAPQVISALPDITPGLVKTVLAQRAASPDTQKRILQDLGPAQRLATVDGSNAIRTTVEVNLDNGFRTRSEIVILLNGQGNEPFSVLSWQDGFETLYRGGGL